MNNKSKRCSRECWEPAVRVVLGYAGDHPSRCATVLDTQCKHQRPIGTTSTGVLDAILRADQKDYRLSSHPVRELFRGVYQMPSRTQLLRGLILMFGHFWDFVRGAKKSVDIELQRFHRKEQMQRLKGVFSRCMR
jgi:hypothetical protein